MPRPSGWPRRPTSIASAATAANTAPLPSVEEALAYPYSDSEKMKIARNRSRLFVGSPSTVLEKLQPLISECQADELMVITAMDDHEARKRSYDLLADVFQLQRAAA